jgi:CO dehydrogenase nickel-insertion accessory protein CooC1
MAEEIGVEDVRVVANRIASPDDEEFVRGGLPGREILACIPFSEAIRRADRAGLSVLEGLGSEIAVRLEGILRVLDAEATA